MTRIWCISGAMVMALVLSIALTPRTVSSAAQSLDLEAMIPEAFGEWQVDQDIIPVLPSDDEEEDSLANRIYDQTLARAYRNGNGDVVMLVIAYGASQSDALQLHRPELCYASLGFKVSKPSYTQVDLGPQGAQLPVVQLGTKRNWRQEPVTYWTRVAGSVPQTTLSRQWAKIQYGLQGKVPDGVLVRVSTITNKPGEAFSLHKRFVREMLGAIDQSGKTFLIGDKSVGTV